MQENKIIDWLVKRGITPTTIEQFGVTAYNHPIIGESIKIPIHDIDGSIIFSKYRRSPFTSEGSKYTYDTGAKMHLYGWWQARHHDTILVCEGELDALTAWSNNIPAVSGTGGCGSWKDEWSELLKDKNVLLCYDNDEPGCKAVAKRITNDIPHAGVVLIPDRPNIKDLTDYTMNGGNIHELLRTAAVYADEEGIKDDRAKRLSVFESVIFHNELLERLAPPPTYTRSSTYNNDTDIERAKEVPIPTLLKFVKNKAACPWHNDSTPSLHYYPKTNSVYCFGCDHYGDSIDVYRSIHNCSFKVAVNALKT